MLDQELINKTALTFPTGTLTINVTYVIASACIGVSDGSLYSATFIDDGEPVTEELVRDRIAEAIKKLAAKRAFLERFKEDHKRKEPECPQCSTKS